MSGELVSMPLAGKALEDFVVRGNLAALSPADKAAHYIALCQSLGLNPATKPFEYLTLQGKETLYARRDCTDQLRKIHSVSITIVSREQVGDVYVVTARATLPNGRQDESVGAVTIKGLAGEVLANALMKCETKAKRRVTLSICGLGMLDEAELDTVQVDRFAALRPQETPPAEKPAEKRAEQLPPLPDKITVVPDSILGGIPALKAMALEGVPLDDMQVEQLEALFEHTGAFYDKYSRSKAASELGLKWLRAICADVALRTGNAR